MIREKSTIDTTHEKNILRIYRSAHVKEDRFSLAHIWRTENINQILRNGTMQSEINVLVINIFYKKILYNVLALFYVFNFIVNTCAAA